MRDRVSLAGQFLSSPPDGSLPETGLVRVLLHRGRTLALVSSCPHRRTASLSECTQILLCPTRTASQTVLPSFVKNRERALKVRLGV